jgi:GNAT superfamily N-acetyltransferase
MSQSPAIQIDYLANHPQAVPILAGWFYKEWREYYAGKTVEDVADAIRERGSVDHIPLTLVALADGVIVGTVCLKINDCDVLPQLSPWLAGLYVDKAWRNKGIGARLVDAIIQEARQLGICTLYLWTPTAEAYYACKGWSVRTRIIDQERPTIVMQKQIS